MNIVAKLFTSSRLALSKKTGLSGTKKNVTKNRIGIGSITYGT